MLSIQRVPPEIREYHAFPSLACFMISPGRPGRTHHAAAGVSLHGIKRGMLWFAFKDSASTPELRAWWAETARTTSSHSWWPSSK